MERLALMPKYDDYVDSGVEWLGRVPASWELTRLGTRFNERRSKVSDIDYPALSVTKKGVLPQLDNAAKTKDGDNRKLVKEGDFVINSRSDRKGSSGVSDRDGSVSLINIVLKPKGIHPKFSEHLLKSHAFIEEYYRVGRGIVADLWTTRYDEMRTIAISVPSLEEQTRIANFLDKKTTQIDEAIAIKEQQISLLKERKQIIIQQAVTQGLDPNVPMKESGVDWIGKIPAHWDTLKFKYSMRIKARLGWKGLKAHEYVEESDFGFLSTPNIKHKRIKYEDAYFITERRYFESPEIMLENGDVLLVKDGSTLGISNVVEDLPMKCTVNSSIAVLKLFNTEEVKPKYLDYFIKSESLQRIISIMKDGMGVPHLFQSDIKNFVHPLPPIGEQLEIIEHVKMVEESLDSVVLDLEKQIENIKEYKTTLINSAVTGKIKITPEMVEQ
ncbi:restriction endonuclease subunit S [Pseudidiomarina sp. GXY010]|uniref:Restriction endonuclease subunit S n=1 Tax=Pseudidiomarina fusca TaxID=2965078 RepID=A0ABU3KUS2_9GAMM|nr:restriction endonuclease subunit S [Pseudidiomarina sp. GXY010]MDT7525109.1 restriction endonuclease subunit S [Pseudidiomarina sp. GXY010]